MRTRNFLFFLVIFSLMASGCYYPRYYGLPVSSGNYVYDRAFWKERARLYREARRQAEAAERERAKNDARQGIYRPW